MKDRTRPVFDVHLFPPGENEAWHNTYRITSCRCEPVPQYIENPFTGEVARFIIHGKLIANK